MNVKASVLLITCNHAAYVAQAIESALAQQTGFPYEIVIGDDCSTDGTRQIVIDYQRRFPDRIRLILPERSLGARGNKLFLAILAACTGDYVAFLDGDDYWTSAEKLHRQAAFLDGHAECGACFHNVRIVYEDEKREPYSSNPPGQKPFLTVADLLRGNVIQTCSAMVRREPFREVPDWLYTVDPQDWAIYLMAAQHGSIGYLPEVMGVYRRHKSATWYGHESAFYIEKAISLYETVGSHLGPEYEAAVEEQRSRRYYDLSRVHEKEGHWRAATVCLEKAMEGHPRWMEEYLPGVGVQGPAVWRLLDRHVRLHRWPMVSHLLQMAEPWLDTARLGWSKRVRRIHDRSTGTIVATPNPVRATTRLGHGCTTLSWTATKTGEVEVRIGAPDGVLFSRSGPTGSLVTDDWVSDGMRFYLQDVSEDKPRTLAHTLDMVRVKVVTG